MKKKLKYAVNAIMHDKWSSALIIILLFLLVLNSISERLYSGENSTLIVIFLGVSLLCLIGRWIYLTVRSLKSGRSQVENAAGELDFKMKQGSATLFLTYAAFWALLWYLGSHNHVTNWATAILVAFFVIAAVVALIRPAE